MERNRRAVPGNRGQFFAWFGVACGLLMATMSCGAATLVYEGFDYPAGSLLQNDTPLNGGGGFTSGWEDLVGLAPVEDQEIVEAGSLAYPGLTSAGNSLRFRSFESSESGIRRHINQIPGTSGTTVWLSFLVRKDSGTSGFDACYLELSAIGGATVRIGDIPANPSSNAFSFSFSLFGGTGTTDANPTNVPVGLGITHWVLASFEFGTTSDVLSLYVDRQVGGPLGSPDMTRRLTNFNGIAEVRFWADNMHVEGDDESGTAAYTIDEFRIEDVPEPGTTSALMVAAALFLARRRRAKSPRS